jgi:hypothetical protein
MSLLTQASPFSNGNEGTSIKTDKMKGNMVAAFKRIQDEQSKHALNDAAEYNAERTSKVEEMVANMGESQSMNDGDRLADFVVSPPPVARSLLQHANTPASYTKNAGSSFSQSYGATPYYQGPTTTPIPPLQNRENQQLMEKLNYMIHLLEEQQKEPTQNIMEEFALYSLLGIFMIYIVDSFARVGKYTR